MSHTEPFGHGRIFLQRLPYLVVANIEQMFYNNHIATYECAECERVVTLDGRETVEYPAEMTNEEYRDGIFKIFSGMDRNDKLRFWYRYISAIENGED